MLFSYDKTLGTVETSQGTMTLTKVFIPFFLEMFLMNFMQTVNTFMLSYFSDNAVAAVGAAGQFSSMIYTFYSVIGTGVSIVLCHHLGAGKKEQTSEAVFSALVFGAALSAVISILMSIFARPCMTLLNIKGDVLDDAAKYFSICMQFSFLPALFVIISSIFKSYGFPQISVGISLGMNILNAALNYLVIFQPFPFFLKGVSGIAWCSNISRGVALICIIICLFRLPLQLDFHKMRPKSLLKIKEILRVGLPGGISSLSYNVSQTVTTSVIALVGVSAISTKIYVSNLVFYVYVLGLSLGMLFLFGRPLLSLFTKDPDILKVGCALLFWDIFVEIFRGFNHIEENSLRGAGDVVFPMIVSICSCWTMSVLFSYILGVKLGLGLTGCWIAFAMDEAFRGINYFFRWKSKKWMKKTVV